MDVKMTPLRTAAILSILAAVGCDLVPEPGLVTAPLAVRVLCGSSMAKPIETLAKRFEAEANAKVTLTLGGCETLLPQIELGAPADIFIGHAPFEDLLAEKGLRQDRIVTLGAIRPAVVVAKGNPKGLGAIHDLTRQDVRVGLPDARYSTCGEVFEAAATERGILDAIHARTVYTARTHQELATALLTGNVDVVVVWNFIAAMHSDKTEVVPVGVDFDAVAVFATAVKNPESPDAAQRFLDFLDTAEAKKVFETMGYTAAGPTPVTLTLYCAAGVQKPIDELVGRFQSQHAGVTFEVVYQGSGALLGQITLNEAGDLYVAGDEAYMDQARERGLLVRAERMAVFTPVLAVPKGNPAGVNAFSDLTREGVRLGLGDERVAAVGKVARGLLERLEIWDGVQKNVVVTAGTVNQLALQAAAGNLDAAIIWDATARQFEQRLEIVDRGDQASQVGVPIGILKFSTHKNIAEQFVQLATSAEAALVFRKHGFEVARTVNDPP